MNELARQVGLAAVAGAVAGALVGGVLGRIVMRVSALMAGPGVVGVPTSNGNLVGDVTLGGTIGLAVVGLAAGLLGGVGYAAVEPSLRSLRPWHGPAFGVGLLAALGWAVLDPANFDFGAFGSRPVNVAMFAALFVLFGVVVAWIVDRLRPVAAGGGRVGRAVDGLARLAALLVALLGLVALVNIGSAEDALTATVYAAAVALAGVARWRGLPSAVAYAALAIPVLIGTVRLAGTLPALLTSGL